MINFFRSFARNRGAVIGLVILSAIILLAVFAPLLFVKGPWTMIGRPFQPPGSGGFLLGSDTLGRDVAAGIVHGARISLFIGLVATAVATLIGISLGAIAGYYASWIDDIVMGISEFFQTIPILILLMVLVAVLTPSIYSTIIGIGVVSWPPVARVVRSEFLTLRTREFVEAAKVLGHSNANILFTQILPNSLSPIIVAASLMVATAILMESALSFLGLGDPNQMTWGYMIGIARSELRHAWWMSFFPGLAIVLTVLSINLVGEGLNDALNPRLARRARA